MRAPFVIASAALFAAGAVVATAEAATVTPATTAVAPLRSVQSTPVSAPPVSAPPGGLLVAIPHSVTVALTPTGCAPAAVSVPAGPVTVTVGNANTQGVSEAELAGPDGVVLAEAEDVGPGLSGSFSLTLQPGHYVVNCQATSGPGQTLQVTTTSAQLRPLTAAQAQTHRLLLQAGVNYGAYVQSEVAALLSTTKAFTAAVYAGDVALAQQRYPAARTHYERIESVAETFGQLDALIDERANDVPPGQEWAGFHRLENALWVKHNLTGMRPIAGELALAVANLKVVVDRAVLEPAQLADGAAALLSEVGATKITGEEERYSHLDAVDLTANVEGAQRAATLLAPGLRRLDPAAEATLTRRFAALDDVVAGIPTAVRSDWLLATPTLKEQLSAAVDAAAAPLAAIAAEVAAA